MERVSDEWLDEQISLYDHLGDEISDLGKERCAALVELRDRRAADDPEDAEYASYEASKAQAEQLAAMTAGQLERLGSGVMFELMRRAAEREQAAPSETSGTTCAPRVELRDGPVKRSYAEAAEYVLRKRADTWKKLAAIDAGEQAAPEPRNVQCHDVADFYKDEEPQEQAAAQGDPHGETFVEACCRFTKEVDEMRRKVAEALGVCEEAAPTEPRLAKWERRLKRMGGSLRYNAESGQWEVWREPTRGDVMDTVDYGKTLQEAVKAAWQGWKEERGE